MSFDYLQIPTMIMNAIQSTIPFTRDRLANDLDSDNIDKFIVE